jgi:hypothetical protein
MSSEMTSRELVKASIYHQGPDRLPVFQGQLGVSDNFWINPGRPEGFQPVAPEADEWGCVWGHTDMKNMGQVVGHPMEDGYPDDLSQTVFPDYHDPSRYAHYADRIALGKAKKRYICTSLFFVLWERLHALRGFENALCDLLTDRENIERLADHVVEVNLGFVHEVGRRFSGQIDAITMTDDWGTQQAAFISFDLWTEVFLPRYKRLFDTMHEYGFDVWVHSCGKVNEIIEGYIQAGVDVVNLQQPRALGIEEIGRRYGGQITFESLCDIQATLPSGDESKIDADVEALMTHWARPDGGFLFSDYGDGAAIGVGSLDTKRYMYEQFSRWSETLYGRPLPELPVPAAS